MKIIVLAAAASGEIHCAGKIQQVLAGNFCEAAVPALAAGGRDAAEETSPFIGPNHNLAAVAGAQGVRFDGCVLADQGEIGRASCRERV